LDAGKKMYDIEVRRFRINEKPVVKLCISWLEDGCIQEYFIPAKERDFGF